MIEVLLESILNKIHQKSFSAPKQLAEELGRLIIRDDLSPDQYSYISSKIFNSELNLFAFVNANNLEKDRNETNLRKEILEIISDYMQVCRYSLINYLEFIKNSSLTIYKTDYSMVVKESALKIIVKMLQSYDATILDSVIQCNRLSQILLDEIKLIKPSASVKGRIWQILGELIRKFPEQMLLLIVEIQEVSFYGVKSMMEDGKNVELKTLTGLLQLTRAILDNDKAAYPETERRTSL